MGRTVAASYKCACTRTVCGDAGARRTRQSGFTVRNSGPVPTPAVTLLLFPAPFGVVAAAAAAATPGPAAVGSPVAAPVADVARNEGLDALGRTSKPLPLLLRRMLGLPPPPPRPPLPPALGSAAAAASCCRAACAASGTSFGGEAVASGCCWSCSRLPLLPLRVSLLLMFLNIPVCGWGRAVCGVSRSMGWLD